MINLNKQTIYYNDGIMNMVAKETLLQDYLDILKHRLTSDDVYIIL